MTSPLEYHVSVRHSIPASVALFSLLALPLILVSTSHAQINGTPASVTSPGFGGRPVNGTPPSVTSLGPRGFAPNSNSLVTFSTINVPHTGDGHHRRHRDHGAEFFPPLLYAVPVPYAVDIGATDTDTDTDDDNDKGDASADDRDPGYRGGPTIFDRRGSGAASYIPPVKNVPRPHAVQNTVQNAVQTADQRADVSPVDPGPPPIPTLLIFRDGRKLELGNYAIIGQTLFDLTPGHARRVALADLDPEATRQQNDDRGVTFQLPQPPQAN
jgi:hypothetical protein